MHACRNKMPGHVQEWYPCCLCKRKVAAERFCIKAKYARLLEKQLCVLVNDCDALCSKFKLKCDREEHKKIAHKSCLESEGNLATIDEFELATKQGRIKRQTPSSPQSVTLNISTTSLIHNYCFICKKNKGPKINVPPPKVRQDVFIRQGIVVPTGERCLAHLTNDLFNKEVISKIKPLSQEVNLHITNSKHLLEVL